MTDRDNYSTWVEVDLSAIRNNTRLLLERANGALMAVVKADAYGHGAVAVARAALEAGCTWLGVARVEEARQLRHAGVHVPMLLMGYTPPGRMAAAIAQGLSVNVWEIEQARAAAAAGLQCGEIARLHLKIDTGMNRLGAHPSEALALAQAVDNLPGACLEGVFTHYARADETDDEPTEVQEQLFLDVLAGLDAAGLHPPFVHAYNSAATLRRSNPAFNLVRTGIALYGMHPSSDDCRLPEDFQPALSWKSILAQVKRVPAGRGVSYGHEYITRDEELIGTVAVGYADGFRRTPGNQVLVGGKRCPVIGRVCMDQAMVRIDAEAEAEEGAEVVLIGRQGDERISAEEVAGGWGTVNYEVVCGIASRVPREYLKIHPKTRLPRH